MAIFKRDSFGHITIFKKWLIRILGAISHPRFKGINNLNIKGAHIIGDLPDCNVLFISNHQTYFADVAAMIHVFNASLSGRTNSLKNIGYLWKPKLNLYFIAAKEMMQSGLLPKIMSHAGAIHVERTWRSEGKDVKRELQSEDVSNINKALKNGWLITFPQGTTKAWTPIRKGTAHIIQKNQPIVVPVVIDGFRRSFDKKGLVIKKKGVQQSIEVKKPLEIDYNNDTIEEILEKVEYAIEQHPSFLRV
jgi:1-acyl-sn-glycerol-3-phosphate acyltransferase